jgi:hypothetical protein
MNLRARRALDAGTLVTDFKTSSFSIVPSLARLWNKFKVVQYHCAVLNWIELTYRMSCGTSVSCKWAQVHTVENRNVRRATVTVS